MKVSRSVIDGIRKRSETESGLRFIRKCERCDALCVDGVTLCRCCELYGTKSGGPMIRYPDDGKHHVTLCSTAEFLARADCAASSTEAA